MQTFLPFDRRQFLRLSGMSLALLGLERSSLAGVVKALPAKETNGALVVLFQRGAADGLHMVVPYRDRAYRPTRGALALAEPGSGDGATLDLADGFALHPALASLHKLYKNHRLAVVHAVGSPDLTRSHFDAQDYMESGTPGRKSTRDGWLARALDAFGARGEPLTPFAAVALTSTLPRSLAGAGEAMAMKDFSKLNRRPTGDASLEQRIEELYGRDHDPDFVNAGAEAFAARRRFAELNPLARPTRPGVRYPRGRAMQGFQQLAKLLKSDLGVRVAFLDSGGWDTHFNQGGATGAMANHLRDLGDSAAAFLADIGDDRAVTLLTATEFGRTVAVNGAGGTDHGHGTAMFVAGSGVRGGRVITDWPGLQKTQLHEGRDLAVTTDFRSLFHEVATHALGLPASTALFPDFRPRVVGVIG